MPLVRHWLRYSILVFAVAIALGLVSAHTSLVQPHDLQWDRTLQTDTRTGWLNTVLLGVSYVVSPVGGLLILGAWTLWLLVVRHRPTDAVSTFLVVAVGWNAAQVGKLIVGRNRPPAVYSLDPEIGSNSFPSGHVCFTVSAALAAYFLVREARHRWPVAFAGAATVVLIAFARLYIGAHYPTDVVGSVLVSSAAVLCLTGLWHAWLLPRLHRVPLLTRFGPLESPATANSGEATTGAAETTAPGRAS